MAQAVSILLKLKIKKDVYLSLLNKESKTLFVSFYINNNLRGGLLMDDDKQLHPKFISSMPIGDAVLDVEEVVIKEKTDIKKKETRNIKEID